MINYKFCCSLLLPKNKKLTLITAILLFFSQSINSVFAQTATYKVQIGAYKNLNMNNFSNLKSIGTILTEDAGKGTTRIILGYYNTKAEAEQVLAQVKNIGYPTAFVSASKNPTAVLPPPPPTKNTTHTPSSPTKAISYTPNTANTTPPPTAPNTNIALAPNEELLIEIITYAPNEQIKDAERLNKIFELGDEVFMESINENTKVLIGRYPNLKVAQEKQKIIQNIGYTNTQFRKVPKLGVTEPTTKDPNPIPPPTAELPTPVPNIAGTHTPPPTDIPQTNIGNQLLPIKLPPNALIVLQNLFRTSAFEVAKIGVYNPLDPTAQTNNYQLQGVDIPTADFAFFAPQSLPNNIETKALYRFKIDDNHEGFLVRHSQKDNYNANNNINLYVINTQLEQLISVLTISSINQTNDNTPQTKKISWIMDLDGDEKLDLATMETIRTTNPDNTPNTSEILSAKVWQNGDFVTAEIDDPRKLKQKLQVE